MGIFYNDLKPGKGIDKDAPKKRGPFLFFELLWRKLGMIFTSNLLYFFVSLPVILVYHFLSFNILGSFIGSSEEVGFIQIVLLFTTLFTVIFGTGPISCGYAYLMRGFAREEHVFVAADFFEKAKQNFKQGLAMLIIDLIVITTMSVAILFYHGIYKQGHLVGLVMLVIMVFVAMLYTFMHFYTYQFIVTFENKMLDILKNSLLMAIATLPMGLVITAMVVVITYLLYSVLTPVAIVLVMALFWISLMRFVIDFYSARAIKRHLIDARMGKEEQND